MKVLNVHTRLLKAPLSEVIELFGTLSTPEDKVWPTKDWPAMRFKDGLKINAEGGHGPIRYKVIDYQPSGFVEFLFQRPIGFNGIHRLEVNQVSDQLTEVKHTIDMETTGIAILSWPLAIRWLHDALLEDAFDKMEHHLFPDAQKSKWNLWVRILRKVLSAK